MSPKGKMIFVSILVLLIAGTLVLKGYRQSGTEANGDKTAVAALPVFMDIMTPT